MIEKVEPDGTTEKFAGAGCGEMVKITCAVQPPAAVTTAPYTEGKIPPDKVNCVLDVMPFGILGVTIGGKASQPMVKDGAGPEGEKLKPRLNAFAVLVHEVCVKEGANDGCGFTVTVVTDVCVTVPAVLVPVVTSE